MSAHVAWFGLPESNAFVANNLYEATRGRATVTMAGLSQLNRGHRLTVTKGAPWTGHSVRELLHGAVARGREYRGEAVASPGHRGASDSLPLPDAWRQYLMPKAPKASGPEDFMSAREPHEGSGGVRRPTPVHDPNR